jgi:glyoxylase-like metal-dependent hydrolase (beta-lactamase superfamily II)
MAKLIFQSHLIQGRSASRILRIAKDIYLVGGGDIRLSNRMDCHIYLVDGGRHKCLIDAGVGVNSEQIIRNIVEDGYNPKKEIDYILITHAHADHAGGTRMMRRATGAEVVAPRGEAELMESGGPDTDTGMQAAKESGIYPKTYVYKHCKVDRVVGHRGKIKVGKYTLRVIQVPGHSRGVVGYLIEEKPRSFFSSDIVFIEGTVGFGNWPGCSLDNYRNYIGRLAGLNVVSLFPGHFMWTLKQGQSHLDTAIKNFKGAWLPPAWNPRR